MKKQPSIDFLNVAKTPIFWWFRANNLFTSAVVLLESNEKANAAYFGPMPKTSGIVKLSKRQQRAAQRLHLSAVAHMLFGLAFEVALKGMLVAKRPEFVGADKLSESLTGKHELVELFKTAEIPLSHAEQRLVRRLSQSILWAGRYPVPKKCAAYQYEELPDGSCVLPGDKVPGDIEAIMILWNRVHSIIQNDPSLPKYKSVQPLA
ncbi:MAG: hypothetical protein ABFD66_04840 [Smithella sp.]